MHTVPSTRNTHESLGKALKVLLSFTPDNREKSATELGRELGFHVSTVSRLLRALVAHGFLFQDEWTRKYSLGKSAFDIGNAIYQSVREKMVIIAQPYVDELRDSIEQDVAFEVLLDNTTILAYRAAGPPQFRTRFSVGDRLPIHIVAGGKAILAFSSPEVVDRLLKGGLTPLTQNSITDLKTLKECLGQYRQTGLAYDLGESDVDYDFVAAPVFNYGKRPVAAVVTGDLAHRVKGRFEPRILDALKGTAAKISARLLFTR
jgi:IclR family transcriptional regulator, KDG regulon repressor